MKEILTMMLLWKRDDAVGVRLLPVLLLVVIPLPLFCFSARATVSSTQSLYYGILLLFSFSIIISHHATSFPIHHPPHVSVRCRTSRLRLAAGRKVYKKNLSRRTYSSLLHYTVFPMDSITLPPPPPSSFLVAEAVVVAETTTAAASAATWKQYLSLGVILIVVLDIILGSPLLNMVTAPLKRKILLEEDSTSSTTTSNMGDYQSRLGTTTRWDKGKERVDTEAIAKEALDKANSAIGLRDYLERNKTDKDRMEQLQREIDRKLLGGD
jgi:hypothetical protein